MAIWSVEIKEIEKLYGSLRGQLPDLEKELDRLIKADDENMILLYSRRCLEVLITDLCERELNRPRKTEPLKGIIDKLYKEEKIPSHIKSSMHGLNDLSTYGAHPKEFDLEQVKPVLINLDIIIKWYLKYKETGTDNKGKQAEEIGRKIHVTGDILNRTGIPKKRLTGLVSLSMLLIVIVVMVLFLTKIVGNGKRAKEVEISIAVLPFHNFSKDINEELRSDALTNEIINHLYKIKSFDRVVPFLSVMLYKRINTNIPIIANELNVNYILDGTYQRIGDSLKITANLIDPHSDKYIWQHDYKEPYKEIISILSDIALQIASHVNAFLTVPEKQDILKKPTNNQEAYDLIQQAVVNHFKALGDPNYDVTDEYYIKNKNLALKAIELDPNYSDAYAWAGLFSVNAGAYAGNKEMSVAAMEALPFIEKALELDQNNSQAHFTMANINEWGQWDYIKAEKEYLKVFELAPNKSQYYSTVGEFFLKMNQLDKAIFFSKKAFESELIDPTSVLIETLFLSGNKIEAISTIEKYLTSQRNPDYQRVGECFIWLEEYDSARFYLETALKHEVPEMLVPRFQACLAFAYFKTKNPHQAQAIINQLMNKSKETSAGSPDYFIGWYYSRIGEVDFAFYWIERAYQYLSAEMPWLKVDPAFKNLKNDDRYWDLYKRTGHKAYDMYRASLKE